MTPREERGLAIAKAGGLVQKGWFWQVPSQSGKGHYVVVTNQDVPHCSCPDHEEHGLRCKHIFAVEFSVKMQQLPDGGAALKQTVTVTETIRKTYAQNWPAYNAAQTNEKAKLQMLLHDLCKGIQEAPQRKKGRKRLPLADALFSAIFKVYSTFSGRRFMTDLREAHGKGYISKLPHYNSIFNYLEMPELTPVLHSLVTESARCLKSLEDRFAVDSTGFSTCRYARWFDAEYGKTVSRATWIKTHLMCGVKTNVVTSVEISDSGDAPQLPGLVNATAKNFTIKEVSGDKAYLSVDNLDMIDKLGAEPYIPFKVNSTRGGKTVLWEKLYHYFHFRQDDFLRHYHLRSNVESTFSMIKRKFGDHLRSKSDTAMVNEVLCKVICHNICVLIQTMYEIGFEPNFWAEIPAAQNQGEAG